MKTTFSLLATALVLGACASSAPPATTTTAQATPQRAGEASLNGPTSTGTRLQNRSTDRIVRVIGNQAFKEDADVKSLGNEVGGRSN